MKIVYKADRDKEAIIRTGVAFTLLALLIASVISGNSMAADAAANTKEASGFFGFIFTYLSKNPFVFLFLCLAVGYPLGWITVKGISLGTTAGTLVVGVLLALGAFAIYDLKIDAPGLVSDIFLMMFMYAIGMKVGPQFFSGLARGGMDFVVIGLIVVFSNFAIVVAGTKMLEMAPGYAAGIISGSYTVTRSRQFHQVHSNCPMVLLPTRSAPISPRVMPSVTFSPAYLSSCSSSTCHPCLVSIPSRRVRTQKPNSGPVAKMLLCPVQQGFRNWVSCRWIFAPTRLSTTNWSVRR
jgi:AspT/YidE/YbjL antiporter-like protein